MRQRTDRQGASRHDPPVRSNESTYGFPDRGERFGLIVARTGTGTGGGEPSAVKSAFCSASVFDAGKGVLACLFIPVTFAVARNGSCMAAAGRGLSLSAHGMACGGPAGRSSRPGSRRRAAGSRPPRVPDSNPAIGEDMIRTARITGKVEYREGDGANITIRPGPCEIDETALDATISWTDGDSHGSAAMPLTDYRRYIASKAIQIDGIKAA